jgi:hypothetical protein
VLAHPKKKDLAFLYNEANTREDFKLIFFGMGTLKGIDFNLKFKNNNVFFKGFPIPSELVEMINND